MAKKRFPDTIYVRFEENNNDDGFLSVDEGLEMSEDGEIVAVYELRETRTMKVTRELE